MASNALEQELLRKRLRPAEYIARIEESIEILRTHWQTLNKNQIDAHSKIIDANRGLLAKCLPDLRAIEVTPERESPVKFIFASGDEKTGAELKKALGGPEVEFRLS